ncbi:MAG: DUF3102 domain-containing protein [Anaerovoracaceae bacterium]
MNNIEIKETEITTKESIIVEIKTTIAAVEESVLIGAIKIGRKLNQLKELVPHGEWYEYIEDNIGFSKRKVQNFIQISETYGKEGTAFSELITKTHTCAHLSYSNALRLLAVDEEDIEEFVENHIEDGQTVKELEEEIKKYKAEKEELNIKAAALEEMENRIKKIESEKNQLINEKKQLENKLVTDQGTSDEKNSQEIENLNNKIKNLEEKAKAEKLNQDQAIEKAKIEAVKKVEANKEEELEKIKEELNEKYISKLKILEEEINTLDKRAQNSSNEKMIKFKLVIDDLQRNLQDIKGIIKEATKTDAEKGKAMTDAVKKVISMFF